MDKPFHVIIPTLTFDVFYNKFFNGIKAFEPLKEYLSFGIVFQKYTKEQIRIILDEFNKYNLDVRYIHKEYNFEYGKTEMHVIRNDACQLNNQCLYYWVCDDDQWYDAGNLFTKEAFSAMNYLLENDKCGILTLVHDLDKNKKIDEKICIQFASKLCAETYLGTFVKNTNENGLFVPEEYLHLFSGFNDLFFTYIKCRDLEYYRAQMKCSSGHHVEAKPRSEVSFETHGWKETAWDEGSNMYMLDYFWRHGYEQYSHPYISFPFDINEFYDIEGNLVQLEERLQNNLKVKYI